MPKPTFFNLPEEKKQTLTVAVKEEFSRTSLAEACISNIVHRANIPRGSFYQYFENKEDAYFYVLSQFVDQLNDRFMALLQARNGDLFATMIDFFQLVMKDKENFDFLKQAFLNLNYKIETAFSNTFMNESSSLHVDDFGQFVDKERLNCATEKQFMHVMKIVTAVTLRNLIEKYAHNVSDQEAIDNYKLELALLQKGLATK